MKTMAKSALLGYAAALVAADGSGATPSVPFATTYSGAAGSWTTCESWSSGQCPLPCGTVEISTRVSISQAARSEVIVVEATGRMVLDENGAIELGDYTGDCCAPLAASTGHGWQQDASECVPDTAYPTAAPTIHPTRAAPTEEEKADAQGFLPDQDDLGRRDRPSPPLSKLLARRLLPPSVAPTVHASMVNCTEAPQTKKVRRLMVADEEALEIIIEITADQATIDAVEETIEVISNTTSTEGAAAQDNLAGLFNTYVVAGDCRCERCPGAGD